MIRRLITYNYSRAFRATVPSRTLFAAILNKTDFGCVQSLKNDQKPDETKESYKIRSFNELKQLMKSNQFYMYVDKATLKGFIYPGHIACFVTSSQNSSIIGSSFISLRNGEKIPDLRVKGCLAHDPLKKELSFPISTVKFVQANEEFNDFLFDKAVKGLPPEKDVERFLISIQQEYTISQLTDLAGVKQEFHDQANNKYILIDGDIVVESDPSKIYFSKSCNCVNGFYAAIGVRGVEPNPSPQMAAWSALNFFLGKEKRDKLISNTLLMNKASRERVYDDDLTSIKVGYCSRM